MSITLSGSNSTFVFIHTIWNRVCNSWKVVSVVIKRSATQWHIIESVLAFTCMRLKGNLNNKGNEWNNCGYNLF